MNDRLEVVDKLAELVLSERGVEADLAACRAAIRICQAYGIRGEADPGHIANVISAEAQRV